MHGAIYNDDSFLVLHEIAQQCSNPVIVTDPPFNIGYHYRAYADAMPKDVYYRSMAQMFSSYPSVVIHYPEQLHRLSIEMNKAPVKVVSWVYNANTAKQHRDIAFYDVKPDFELVRRPYKDYKDKRVKRLALKTGGARSYDWVQYPQVKNKSPEKTKHPCQMPLSLMDDVIGWLSGIDDITVIDPFSGSGTTAVACQQRGIPWIAIEIDEEYCEIIRHRVSTTTKKEPQFFFTDPNVDISGSTKGTVKTYSEDSCAQERLF